MKKSVSSQRWLKEHFADPYVKASKLEGYRSRAVYKLQQIQEKHRLIKQGMCVVDLGAAPGGWSQLLTQWVGRKGKVVALDILPIDPIGSVEIIQGDFTEQAIFDELLLRLAGQKVDVVTSDMAPNFSGIKSSDQAKVIYLAELALEFATKTLVNKGTFLTKLFQGEGFEGYIKELRKQFSSIIIIKPDASRDRSPEIFVVALGFKK
jgi:23S rRNA (uridine2552-2'-O)-methyltransferase